VDGEPSGPNDAGRVPSYGEADGHVAAESSGVGERHNSGAQTKVGVSRIVDEHAIVSSEGVPLELQHDADRCHVPSLRSQELHSHRFGVAGDAHVASAGNICRQLQQRR
jgi:hypothetical protein